MRKTRRKSTRRKMR